MSFGGGDGSQAITQQEAQRQALISQGAQQVNQAFAGYTPQFYEGMRQNVLAAQLPQVQRQYQQTQGQLASNLGNQGLIRSSAARNLGSSLQEQLSTNLFNVSNQATQAVQDLQKNVAGEKSNILGQLEASAQPNIAGQQALDAASRYSAPSIIQPLGNLFQNWSNIYLARQIGQTYGQPQQSQYPFQYQQGSQSSPSAKTPISYNVG